MKIYISGTALKYNDPDMFSMIDIPLCRVIGLVDLDENNCENSFGWSSCKAVVSFENSPYVVDFPEYARLETNDGVLIIEDSGEKVWYPKMNDLEKYDLFHFPCF